MVLFEILENTFLIFGLALLLGIKHSFDADHLMAVSSLLMNSESRKHTVTMSISWSLGHMMTASILTVILFVFRETLLKNLLENMEILVGVMLLVIGLITLAVEFNLISFHKHTHKQSELIYSEDKRNEEQEGADSPATILTHAHHHVHTKKSFIGDEHKIHHAHPHQHVARPQKKHGLMIGIGVIQGIASNDELLLLLTLTLGIQQLPILLLSVVMFSLGVVFGMIIYGLTIHYPMEKWGKEKVSRIGNVVLASLSIFYAIWIFLGKEGLNIFNLFISE